MRGTVRDFSFVLWLLDTQLSLHARWSLLHWTVVAVDIAHWSNTHSACPECLRPRILSQIPKGGEEVGVGCTKESVNGMSWHYSRKSIDCILRIYFCTPFYPNVCFYVSIIPSCCNFVVKFWSWEVWIILFDSYSRFFCLLHLSCLTWHINFTVSLSVFI